MTTWPSNWKTRTLETAGIPVSAKALKALGAWRQSTPLDPWTNNPLGVPANMTKHAKVPGTQYAMYRSINDFYGAFAKFIKTSKGQELLSELISDNGYGAVWRIISSLRWPATDTETDYPAKVLDLASESYRQSVNASDPPSRKTSGTVKAPTAVHDAMRAQAESITQAANAFGDATKAVRYLIRKHARNG